MPDMLPELSANEQPNFQSQGFWIAVSAESCEECFEYTPCFAFLLPSGHEELDLEVEEDEPLEWLTHPYEAFLNEIWSLSANAVERMQSFTETYYVDSSDETETPYWANLCQHCGAMLDEFLIFGEVGGGFCPGSFQQAEEQIKLHWYDEPFWAYSFGTSSGDWVELLIAHEFDVSNPY